MSSPEENERNPSASELPDWDSGIGERLRGLAGPGETRSETLDRVYEGLRTECERSDKSVSGYLRSRSTTVRRLIVLIAFAVILFVAIENFPMVEEPARTARWTVTLIAYGVLLVLTLLVATRPLQLPALSRWKTNCVICVAVGATILAAVLPSSGAEAVGSTGGHEHGAGLMFASCMGLGLLFGVPIYALLRMFDRGNTFGALIAAAAAGLAGNLLLKMHCPVDTTAHVLMGHSSVALLYVAGLGLVHRLIPSK